MKTRFSVSRRSRDRRSLRSRWVAGVASIAIALGISVVGAAPAHAVGKCDFAVLITARGVNASGGSNLQNGRVWLSGGHGPQLQPLVNAMTARAGAMGMPLFVESLAWDASSTSSGFYAGSVWAGVNALTQEIKSIWNSCGTKPIIFLAGHSGGGHVVMDTLQYLRGQPETQMIRGAVVYGNPSNVVNQPGRTPSSANTNGVFARSSADAAALGDWYRYYGWSFDNPSNPNPGYQSEIRSYCNNFDWACTGAANAGWGQAAHNDYTKYTNEARDWLIYLINAF